MYKRFSRSGRLYDNNKFLEHKHLVRRVSERAYEKYLGDILGLNNDRDDQNMGEPPKVKTKNFTLFSNIPSRTLVALLP